MKKAETISLRFLTVNYFTIEMDVRMLDINRTGE